MEPIITAVSIPPVFRTSLTVKTGLVEAAALCKVTVLPRNSAIRRRNYRTPPRRRAERAAPPQMRCAAARQAAPLVYCAVGLTGSALTRTPDRGHGMHHVGEQAPCLYSADVPVGAAIGAPHSSQNFALGRNSAPHLVHATAAVMPPLPIPGTTIPIGPHKRASPAENGLLARC